MRINHVGLQSGRPRYLCRDCRKKFQDKRRRVRSNVTGSLWYDYVWGKQTVEQLADDSHVSIPVMRAWLDAHTIPTAYPYQELTSRPTTLVIDAYFRSRGDGTLIFRSPELKRNLYWKDIAYETVAEYLAGIRLMQAAGWVFTGFTVDGRKGVVPALSAIAPVQYCQFHQKKTIRDYLTKNPKTDAAKELKTIVNLLTVTDEASFRAWLEAWHTTWHSFLKERTVHPDGSTSYTHRRLRAT